MVETHRLQAKGSYYDVPDRGRVKKVRLFTGTIFIFLAAV